MSNTQVGAVYQQIIGDVVESSRVDFEEGGVDESVLEELRSGWQKKLSATGVATFPWDPKPEPQPIMNPPTVPSNAGTYPNMSTPPPTSLPQMSNLNGPRIKTEPGLENSNGASPPAYATIAQQRAAQHLSANYGQRAAASIEAIQKTQIQQPPSQSQAQVALQHQQQLMRQQAAAQQQQEQQGRLAGYPPQQNQPQQGVNRPSISQEEYNRIMAESAAQAAANLRHNSVSGAQTDGGGDYDAAGGLEVARKFNAQGEEIAMGRIEIDNLIRSRIEAMGQSMEGGGLMLSLKKAVGTSSQRRARQNINKTKSRVSGEGDEGEVMKVGGQNDGGDEDVKDKEEDEDAINSDLDDPDDPLGGDDDDEQLGNIMLCMYDKVQRVKNKWKCVMKDGVLTVNGKEYVFHKASGEYEW